MLLSPHTFREKVRRYFNHSDTSGLHSCNKRKRASMAYPDMLHSPFLSEFKPDGRDQSGGHRVFQHP